MAILYSNAFLFNSINSTYEPVAQLPIRRGETVTLRPVYTVTAVIGASDVIRICPVPAGAKVVYLAQSNTDLDSGTTATFGLGNTTSATAYLATQAGLQTASTTVATQAQLDVANNVFVANDYLLLTMSAGPTTATTGTIDWIVQIYMP